MKSYNELLLQYKKMNHTTVSYDTSLGIIDLYKMQVERNAEATALVYYEEELTYRQLEELSDKVAYDLSKKNVKKGDKVAVILKNKLDFIVTVLGIVKLNAAYVPIDPEYPIDRIEFIIENSECKLVIGDSEIQKIFPEIILYPEMLNKEWYPIITESCPEAGLYVMYTSGTTGKPKGCVLPQAGAIRLVIDNSFCELKEHERMLNTSSVIFDLSVFEIWGTLLNGLTLYLTDKKDIIEAKSLGNLLEKHKINVMIMSTSLFAELVRVDARIFEPLDTLIVAGDTLFPASAKLLYDACPMVTLLNGYGPTENSTLATCYEVKRDDVNRETLSIGKVLSRSTVYILDENNELCDINVKGEICVGGVGLAQEYLNQPELSVEKFIYHPELGEKIYKTGDIGAIDKNGNVSFYGRRDNQVKVRGYRIELDEIRNKMLEENNVEHVYVTVEKDCTENKVITAYFVASDIIYPNIMRKWLKEKLPIYSIPNYIYQIESFPLKINGKIDTEKLKSLKHKAINIKKFDYTTEYTNTEKIILNIYKEIFNREDLQPEDDFFQEGGNSLQIGLIIAKIRSEFGIEVSVNTFYSNPQIRQLALYIDENCELKEKEVIIKQLNNEEFSLSPAQLRIYHTCYENSNTVVYNIPYAFLIDGYVDINKLKEAFYQLINRHDILRAVFRMKNETPIQKVLDLSDFIVDLTKIDIAEEYDVSKSYKELFQAFIRPFNLEKGPLWRWQVINFSNEKSMLLFDIHHLIFDGISQEVFFDELSKLYNNTTLVLKNKVYDYIDYVEWNKRYLKGENYKKLGEYWKNFFRQDIKPLEICNKSIKKTGEEKGVISFRLPLSFIDSVNRKFINNNITLYNYVISCLGIVLSKFYNQNNFYIGSILSGRKLQEFSNVIGMFVNTVPYLVNMDLSQSALSYMIDNQKQIIDIMDNQDYSLTDIINCSNYILGKDRNEFIQTVFVMENMEALEPVFGNLKVERLDISSDKAKFDLLFICENEPDGIVFHTEYRRGLVEDSVAKNLSDSIKHVLLSVLERTHDAIKNIGIADDRQNELILKKFNDTKRKYNSDICIHELFKRQVSRYGEFQALSWQGNGISYKELDKKTDVLAYYLKKQGVQIGEVVAVYLDDKVNQIIAIMAILKAGGIYMPIDTGYPEKRTSYMLQDSGAKVILTEKVHENNTQLVGYKNIFIDILKLDIKDIFFKECNIDGESPAYLMYTSGTTGQPKGVIVKHKNVVRLVSNTEFMKFEAGQKFLQTSSVVFDASTLEIWGSLLNGMTLYLTRKEDVLNAKKIREYIEKERIYAIWLSAPLFNQLSRGNEDMFRGVTWLLVGGDTLPAEQIHKVREKNPGLHLLNAYGPTENTTFSTVFDIDDEYNDIPIGYPITNSTVYIMDEGKNILPVGAIGEICVGGEGISAGYLNDYKLNEDKFIEDKFNYGKKLYCTGDLGRWNERGYLEFLGRKDNQVKIRGFRVEIKEIEQVVNRHKNIQESLIDVREKDGIKYLVLLYVGTINRQELKEYLKAELPEYMRPTYVVKIERMPLNDNGKIDHNIIGSIKEEERLEIEYVSPENEIERTICEVWQEVLEIEKVGVTDNYFEIGGDSIKAIRISAKLYQSGIDINTGDIMRMKTIRRMCALIEKVDEEKKSVIIDGQYEMSPIQKWFLDHVKEEQNHFNQSIMLKAKRYISMNELKEAWELLKKHHDLLNAHFEKIDNKMYMVIDQKYETVEFLEIEAKGNSWGNIIEDEVNIAQKSLDIEHGPLCKVIMFNSEGEQHIFIVIHHLIVDNVSWRILVQDLTSILEGNDIQKISHWKKTDTYSAWVNDLYKYVSSIFTTFMEDNIKSVKGTFMGNNQMSCFTKDMKKIEYCLDEENTYWLLNEVNKKYGTKVQDILATAFLCAVKTRYSEKKFTIQMEGYGRENNYSRLNVSKTIGWFTSIYPVELNIKNNSSYEDQIIEVKDKMNSVPNHGIGYNAYFYGKEETMEVPEFAYVSLNYLGSFENDITSEVFEVSPYNTGEEITGYYKRPSIDLNIEIKKNKLVVCFDYGVELYKEEEMHELAQSFMQELKNIIQYCMENQEKVITASDLSAEGLDQCALDDVFASLMNL